MSTQRGEAYRVFFQQLIDELREKHAFTKKRAGQPRNFCHFASAVISGVDYDSFFTEDGRVVASLLIDLKELEENRRLFAWLKQDEEKIRAKFGRKLDWSPSSGVRFSVSTSRAGSIEDDAKILQENHEWFVANLLKFKEVFGPRLRSYKDLTKVS